ncbi:MAG: F0F1 ATP synthase subunit epsilon [Gemmatimonadota bacterium]
MASKAELTVQVVSPEALVYEGVCSAVTLPAWDGRMGVRPGHAPFLGLLGSGVVELSEADGNDKRFYLAGGVVKVSANRLTILSEFASDDVPEGKEGSSGVLDLDPDSFDVEQMADPGNPLV